MFNQQNYITPKLEINLHSFEAGHSILLSIYIVQ